MNTITDTTLSTAKNMHITAFVYPMAGCAEGYNPVKAISANTTQLSIRTTSMSSIRPSLPEAPTLSTKWTHFHTPPLTLSSIRRRRSTSV